MGGECIWFGGKVPGVWADVCQNVLVCVPRCYRVFTRKESTWCFLHETSSCLGSTDHYRQWTPDLGQRAKWKEIKNKSKFCCCCGFYTAQFFHETASGLHPPESPSWSISGQHEGVQMEESTRGVIRHHRQEEKGLLNSVPAELHILPIFHRFWKNIAVLPKETQDNCRNFQFVFLAGDIVLEEQLSQC